MHRVDTATAVASLPSPQAQGTPGFFTKGDPGTPTPATQPGPDWFNMIQEELVYLCDQAGITLDVTKMDFTQVYQAVIALRAAQTLGGLNDVTISSPANGQALIYNGAGWVNGTPASAVDEVYKTLLLNGLGDAIAEGAGTQAVNTWPDPFVDETGIDGAASSGYQHDAARDVIHNGGTGVGSRFAAGTPSSPGGLTSGAAADFNDDNSGTEVTFQPGNLAGTPDIKDRIFAKIDLGSVQDVSKLEMIGIKVTGGVSLGLEFCSSTDDTTYIQRGDVSPDLTTSDQNHDFTGTFSARYIAVAAIQVGFGSQTVTMDDFNAYQVSAVTNMDLISVQRTPLAVPATGHLLALVNNLGSLTYGADLTLSLSRDDGNNWDTATIEVLGTRTVSIAGTPTDCDVLYIEPTFTGASETNLRCRVQSFNNKSFELPGWIPATS